MYLQFGNLIQALSRLLAVLNLMLYKNKKLCEVSITMLAIGDIQALTWTLLYSLQTNKVFT
jgi:hypothetical protein